MQPLSPEEIQKIMESNPEVTQAETEEYQGLLSQRFSCNPNEELDENETQQAAVREGRITRLYNRIFPEGDMPQSRTGNLAQESAMHRSRMEQPGFASLSFNNDIIDDILKDELAECAKQDPDVDNVFLEAFVMTSIPIDDEFAQSLKAIGVNARVKQSKSTFIGKLSLRAIASLSQDTKRIEKLQGSTQYDPM